MECLMGGQLAEVAGVLRDDNAILGEAPSEHRRVVLAASPDVKGVDRLVPAALVQSDRDLR